MRTFFNVTLLLLMFGVPVVAQVTKSSEEAATIKVEAEKSSRAFVAADYSQVLDLTYSRIVEMGGGKAKLLKTIEQEMKALQDSGFKILSHTVGEPQPSVRAGAMLVSIVPTTMKMESPDAFITQPSFWLAVSTNPGKSWTFIDGSSLDDESLKIVLPEAVDKIVLPVKAQPAIERKLAG